jgi:hypothetical protein
MTDLIYRSIAAFQSKGLAIIETAKTWESGEWILLLVVLSACLYLAYQWLTVPEMRG